MVRFLAKASWEMLLRQWCALVRWDSSDLLPPTPAACEVIQYETFWPFWLELGLKIDLR